MSRRGLVEVYSTASPQTCKSFAMLQSVRSDLSDEATAEVIANAQDRSAMMSNLRRRLYDRKAYEHGLAPLMSDVLQEVFRDLPVLVAVEIAPDIDLSLDHMTAVSLLVNEAAMNAAKRVFRKETGTTLSRTAKAERRLAFAYP